MKKTFLALMGIALIATTALIYSCSKESNLKESNEGTPALKAAEPGPGRGRGFGIYFDGKKEEGRCTHTNYIHFCIDWPWAHMADISEIKEMKSSYMLPVYCNTSQNTVDMMFNYSFLSDEEIQIIESDLENKRKLEFPSVNVQTDNEFESIGLSQNITLKEGVYPVVKWSKEEKYFVLTIDFAPIEK